MSSGPCPDWLKLSGTSAATGMVDRRFGRQRSGHGHAPLDTENIQGGRFGCIIFIVSVCNMI